MSTGASGSRWQRIGACAFVGVVGASRFWALDFGAGFDARPDEPGVIAGFDLLRQRTLSPSLLLYGGGYFYPVFLLDTVRQWMSGEHGPAVLDHRAFVVARTWSAFLSVLTVFCVVRAGRAALSAPAGFLAGAIVVVAPLAVREAHFAKADSAAAFASALVLLSYAHAPSCRRDPRAIGVALGVALSTKFLAGIVPAAGLALLSGPRDPVGDRWTGPLRGAVWTVATVAVLNPHWFIWPGASWRIGSILVGAVTSASWLPGGDIVAGPLWYHTMISMRHGCGTGVAVLALPAVVFGLWVGGALRIAAVQVIGLTAALMSTPMVLARFFLPVLPPLAFLTTALAERTVSSIGHRGWRLAAAGVGAMGLLLPPVIQSGWILERMAKVDTRRIAADWVADNLDPSDVVVSWGAPVGAADFGRPPMPGRRVLAGIQPERWAGRGVGWVVWHRYPLPYSSAAPPVPPAGAVLEPRFVVDPMIGDPDNVVLEPLDAFYLPLAGAREVSRPGPRIEVFALGSRGPE